MSFVERPLVVYEHSFELPLVVQAELQRLIHEIVHLVCRDAFRPLFLLCQVKVL